MPPAMKWLMKTNRPRGPSLRRDGRGFPARPMLTSPAVKMLSTAFEGSHAPPARHQTSDSHDSQAGRQLLPRQLGRESVQSPPERGPPLASPARSSRISRAGGPRALLAVGAPVDAPLRTDGEASTSDC